MKKIIHFIFLFFHEHITGVKPPPGFIRTFFTLFILLIIGTVFYSKVEGWSYLDSLYFSVITLATVGYGDLHPTIPISKIFTIVYIFLGVGLGFYIISTFSKSLINGREKRIKQIEKLMNSLQTTEEEK